MYIRPFYAVNDSTQTLAVTATAQTIVMPTNIGTRSIRIIVNGSQTVFWSYLNSTTSTTPATVATSTPSLAGSVETFLLPNDITGISVIAAAVGSTIYVTVGESA